MKYLDKKMRDHDNVRTTGQYVIGGYVTGIDALCYASEDVPYRASTVTLLGKAEYFRCLLDAEVFINKYGTQLNLQDMQIYEVGLAPAMVQMRSPAEIAADVIFEQYLSDLEPEEMEALKRKLGAQK